MSVLDFKDDFTTEIKLSHLDGAVGSGVDHFIDTLNTFSFQSLKEASTPKYCSSNTRVSQGCDNSTYPETHSHHSRPVFLQQTCHSPRPPSKDAQENDLHVYATINTQNNTHFTHRPQAVPRRGPSLIVAGPLRGEKGEQHQGLGTDNLQNTAGRMIPRHQRLFTMLSLERFPPRF